jgi:arabinose-5-phosphate isomerase
MLLTSDNYLDTAKRVFEIESQSISQLSQNLDKDFSLSVDSILNSDGKVIVSGVGKSGIIGKKISATLSSTGTPSIFLHPTEAYHGDFGAVESRDVVILISNSGESDEVLQMIPFLKRNRNSIISMTSNRESTLSKNSDFHLNISVEREACPLQLAPTSSTTATLAMGDALSVALLEAREFKPEDFAVFHPGGSLGRRLLTTVGDVMKSDNIPTVSVSDNIKDVIHKISEGGVGITAVVESRKLVGAITDGDIRRAMEEFQERFFTLQASDIMTQKPKVISPSEKLSIAENLFSKHQIGAIIAVEDGEVVGVLKQFHIK